MENYFGYKDIYNLALRCDSPKNIEQYIDKINGDILSANPNAVGILKKYPSLINEHGYKQNPNYDCDFLRKYLPKNF